MEKVKKKYSLNNSYFKFRQPNSPDTILEIAQYYQEHGELPFECNSDNWAYEAFCERQKRSGVFRSQYFTPDSTALQMAELASELFPEKDTIVMDPCCGSGQLTRALDKMGYTVTGFDWDNDLVETCKILYPEHHFFQSEFSGVVVDNEKKPQLIVGNPPYEVPVLTEFLNWVDETLADDGFAILLIPKNFLDKERPKPTVTAIQKFQIEDRYDMEEDFLRTKINAEIVVLTKKVQPEISMIDPFKNPDLKRGDRITFLEPGNENGKQSNPHLVGRGGYVYSIRADKGELHILYDLAIGEKQPFEKVLEGKTGFSLVTCKKEHYTGCLAMELDNYGDRAEGVNPDFSKGDRVKVIDYPQGPPHLDFAGREGIIHRVCSSVFPNFVYVEFDLKGRERVQKVKMCDKLNIKAIQPTYKSGDPVLISDQHHLFPNRTAKIREHTNNIPKDSIYVEVDRKPGENITSTIPIKLDLIRPIGLLSLKNLPKQPKAMAEQTIYQVEEISLFKILESDLNPRKHFDEHSIDELATSIKEKGVLQPILVRTSGGADQFEVVCGARRYRASLKAGMKTIPAIVRNLDDEEALEMMIIENLQRKDVNPMEEASAIHSLLKHYGNYSEVALRLGKSSRFVAERDTLNNLHENFQTLLYDGEISLGAAYALAKHSVESQQLILDEYSEIKDGELKLKYWVTNSNLIQACERNACDLTKATFDPEDTSFDKAPACSACQSNTANQPVLFQEGNPTCLDAVCFRIKTKTAFNQQLIQAIEDGKILVLSKWGSLEDPGTQMIIKENGATYINRDNFEYLTKPKAPEAPMTLEEVRKEYMEYNDIEEEKALSEEDLEAIKEEFEDGQNDYQEELKDYQEELEQFNKRNSDPLVREAFVIGGYDHVGKSITIRLRGTAAVKASTSQNTSPEAEQIQEQINKSVIREMRAEELDREKIYAQATPLIGKDWINNPDNLTDLEKLASILAISFQNAPINYFLHEKFNLDTYAGYTPWCQLGVYKYLTEHPEEISGTLNIVMRMNIPIGLIDSTNLDFKKNGRPAIMMDLVRARHPKELAEIELNQQGIALARKEKVEKKQADLKAKLAKLEESEESHD